MIPERPFAVDSRLRLPMTKPMATLRVSFLRIALMLAEARSTSSWREIMA